MDSPLPLSSVFGIGALALTLAALVFGLRTACAGGDRRPDTVEATRHPAEAAGCPLPGSSRATTPGAGAVEVRAIQYRTRDGTCDYGFHMVRFADGRWSVHIVSQPGYDGRPGDGHTTHRLTDSAGNRFICWSVPITSYEDAKTIAARWAEGTERYRKTGQRF